MARLPIRFRCTLFCLLALCLAVAPRAAQAADRRVAVKPIEVYNAPELEASVPGLQAAVAGRLSAPGCQVFTVNKGETVEADWIIRFTITRVGSRVSVDGAAEPMTGRSEVFRAYEIAENADGLFNALSTVATALRKGVLSAALPVARPAAPVAPAPPLVAAPSGPAVPAPSSALPPTAPAESRQSALMGTKAAAPTFFSEPGALSRILSTYRYSSSVPGAGLSLAVGDVDRDGNFEILVLTDREIIVFRDDGRDMKEQSRKAVGKGLVPVSLSIGDGDGDGVPEIYVAGMRNNMPTTEVYQWGPGGLAPHGPMISALLRAVKHPEKGLLLLGMVPEDDRIFAGKPRLFRWSNGAYRDQGAFAAPPGAVVTDIDWHRLMPNQPAWAVMSTQNDTLNVYDADGKLVQQSSEEVKGSENVLEAGQQYQKDMMVNDVFRVQGKTVSWQDPSGTVHLLLQKNISLSSLLKRTRSYSKGQIVGFQWAGLGLMPSGQTVTFPGYLPDLDLGPSVGRPGGSTLYALLIQSEGLVLTTKTIRILAWDL